MQYQLPSRANQANICIFQAASENVLGTEDTQNPTTKDDVVRAF